MQFSDSTFNPADWQTEIVKGGNGGTVIANQSNVTGSDGSFRAIYKHRFTRNLAV
jgi:hypothetical protein